MPCLEWGEDGSPVLRDHPVHARERLYELFWIEDAVPIGVKLGNERLQSETTSSDPLSSSSTRPQSYSLGVLVSGDRALSNLLPPEHLRFSFFQGLRRAPRESQRCA